MTVETTTTTTTTTPREHRWQELTTHQVAARMLGYPTDSPLARPNEHAFRQLLDRSNLPGRLAAAIEFPEVRREVLAEVRRQNPADVRVRSWEDSGEIHGVVSPRYVPVRTEGIAGFLQELSGQVPEVQFDNLGGKLDSVRLPFFRSDQRAVGEPVESGVEFTQGCVGNRSVEFQLYIRILVCSNGMVSTSTQFHFEHRHLGDVRRQLWFACREFFRGDGRDLRTDAMAEAREFQRLAAVAQSVTLPAQEMSKLAARAGLRQRPKLELVTGRETVEPDAPISAWDVSQWLNSSERHPWGSPSRLDAAADARQWLHTVDQYAAAA